MGVIARAVLGEAPASEALGRSASDKERAEVLYYLGAAAAIAGEREGARQKLTECFALEQLALIETDGTRSLLRRLERSTGP